MGFDTDFLNTRIQVPILNDASVAFSLDGTEVIDYTHFSLALSLERKLAIWIAWNIDGNNLKRITRGGINFFEDERIPEEFQTGNYLYKNNPLDRGHIARRIDLVWGDIEVARKANNDSFVFTNIAPQIQTFNQSSRGGIWGKLEDSIYDAVDLDQARVSVIGGCIFDDSDTEYRDFKIPAEFYKTLVYEENGIVKTKSFILTQDLTKLEFLDLDAYKVYEVSPTEIESKCVFQFDVEIHNANTFEPVAAFTSREPITELSQIAW